jgi:hypothetical protein
MGVRAATVLVLLLLLGGPLSMRLAAQKQYEKYITTADVEKATGLSAVKLVPKTEEADGDLNFAGQDGKIILSVSFYPASAFSSARSSRSGFKSSLKGVGEEAFVGPADGPPLYILAFRKGSYTVVLNTELEDKSNARLQSEQLVAIAKLIASRM